MRHSSGFTLLEVLAAMTVLSLAAVGMSQGLFVHLKQNGAMEIKTGAIQAAQRKIDELRVLNPAVFPTQGSRGPDLWRMGQHEFEVFTHFCLEPQHCSSPNLRHITVEVAFRGEEVYELQTVLAKLR